jgi:putative hydrolase of the HAD superfamily
MIESEGPILALVERLRLQGIYCGLASNQERNRARHMSESPGYSRVFDGEFYSCDLRHTKPSPEFFAEVVRTAGLDASRTLFIDDRPENVGAASRCGLVAEQLVIWREDDPAAALRQLLRRHGLMQALG